jgi:nitroreductase
MLTGRLFGLIAVRDRYDKPQTIRAGRVWQRAHLLATARGLAARPANGAVELIDLESRLSQPPQTADHLAEITGDSAWQPTFMFYMGYPTQPAAASARRRLESVVIAKSGPRASY